MLSQTVWFGMLFAVTEDAAFEPAEGGLLRAPGVVPEEEIDYDEVYRHGGHNCGDEDFIRFSF